MKEALVDLNCVFFVVIGIDLYSSAVIEDYVAALVQASKLFEFLEKGENPPDDNDDNKVHGSRFN